MATLRESVVTLFRDLDRTRKKQDKAVKAMNSIHAELAKTALHKAEGFDQEFWKKLRASYKKALEAAVAEESLCGQCVKELEALSVPAQAQARKTDVFDREKKKRFKGDHEFGAAGGGAGGTGGGGATQLLPPPRAPLDHSRIEVGNMVAAKVSDDAAPKDDWIVVKVTRIERESSRFDVVDEEPGDDEAEGQRKYNRLPASCIIPFPKPTDNLPPPDFPPGAKVLAVYPKTTALYRATVAGAARKRAFDDYFLEFDDDEEDGVDGLPRRQVPFNRVVRLPEGHRQ